VKAVLVICGSDNVATALEALDPGRRVEANGIAVTAVEAIAAGHKIALRPIAAGAPVIKYGSPIGLASVAIAAGTHVHTHNLSSSRGRGDRAVAVAPGQDGGRLAEPPDAPRTGAHRPDLN
jgi:altronate hydrolase